MTTCKRGLAAASVVAAVLFATGGALAAPMTLAEAQALFPQFSISLQNPNAFQTPCVDANGTMTIVANVGDITQQNIVVAMICQANGYPAFCDGGSVSFDVLGAQLLTLFQVPGFPDAFALEFIVPQGTQTITITITGTCWPQGCIPPNIFQDFAGVGDPAVPNDATSWGNLKALF